MRLHINAKVITQDLKRKYIFNPRFRNNVYITERKKKKEKGKQTNVTTTFLLSIF